MNRKLLSRLPMLMLVLVVIIVPLMASCAAPPPPAPPPPPAEEAPPITEVFEWTCFMTGGGGRGSTSLPNIYLFLAADEIARQTNGHFIISPVTSKALGISSTDVVRAMHDGLVEMADFSAAVASGDIPMLNLMELPGILPGKDILLGKKIFEGLLPYWQDACLDKDVVLITGYQSVGRNIFTSKELTSVEQIDGLKIRAKGESDSIVLKAFGAAPTPIAFAETEMALRRGTVDGMTTVSQGITALKVTDVMNTGFLAYYSGSTKLLGISKQHWDKLPPQFQKILREAFVDAYAALWYATHTNESQALEEFRTAGMTLIELTPEQREVILRAGEEYLQTWLEKAGPKGQEMVDLVRQTVGQQ